MWTKRGKACLILIFSTNTKCESMAYRSFRSEEYSARGVRKVTTGIIRLLRCYIDTAAATPTLLAQTQPDYIFMSQDFWRCVTQAEVPFIALTLLFDPFAAGAVPRSVRARVDSSAVPPQ